MFCVFVCLCFAIENSSTTILLYFIIVRQTIDHGIHIVHIKKRINQTLFDWWWKRCLKFDTWMIYIQCYIGYLNEFDLPVWWSLSYQMIEEEWQIVNHQRCNIHHIFDLMCDIIVLDLIVVVSSIPINTSIVGYFSNISTIIKMEIIDLPLDNKYHPFQLTGHKLHYCLCKHNYLTLSFQYKESVFDDIRHHLFHHFWGPSMADYLLKWY